MSDSEVTNTDSKSLADLVGIRQGGVRAIHLESDYNNLGLAESYILTSQCRSYLERLLSRHHGNKPQRAWTLTGPYGSGKSYFSLFFMNLARKDAPAHAQAIERLSNADKPLVDTLKTTLKLEQTLGLWTVPVTGYRASFPECLKTGLLEAVETLPANDVVHKLFEEVIDWRPTTNSRDIAIWFKRLTSLLVLPPFNYSGVVLILDEMGKPLEYTANNPEGADLYLLQELAVVANQNESASFWFVGILHQSFERYMALLDHVTQQEWSKVQGRFEDIAFTEPPTLQMRLASKAIEWKDEENLAPYLPQIEFATHQVTLNGWRPTLMSETELVELSLRAYPLHPTTLVTLPYIFRRLAQNERSLFAYLAAQEPYGFREFIQRHAPPDFIRLPDLFDYLVANFQGRLYASGRARALTETLERLESTQDLEKLDTLLLKTIGLLNWLGEVSHLQATESMIVTALHAIEHSDETIRASLQNLKKRSVVTYRRFNQTYAIWQGSDVDIDERLEEANRRLTENFNLAEVLQNFVPPLPVIARRHSYKYGTQRYFEVRYVDFELRGQARLDADPGASGLVLICLPTSTAEYEGFSAWAQERDRTEQSHLLIGVIGKASRLLEYAQELRRLHWVRMNTPELRDDRVASRELRTRVAVIEGLILNLLDRSLSLHNLSQTMNCQWFYKGEKLLIKERSSFAHLLSKICDQIYDKSPIIRNELINRQILTSQGAAARRNLIEHMISHSAEEKLGIEGYPPERSMYASLLQTSGLHRFDSAKKSWSFGEPQIEDPLNLRPAWQAIVSFIFAQPPEPRPIDELFRQLSGPPYGLTNGVLPVLLCAFLVVREHETTLYREGSLLPEPNIADWEVLLRRPELFQVAGCRVEGDRAALIERFARGLGVQPAVMPVVRALIRMLKSLPEHAWRTQRLSTEAVSVRRTIDKAYSPERFLFIDLPQALSMPVFDQANGETANVDRFFEKLNSVLKELANATPDLLAWGRDTLLRSCGLSDGATGWITFVDIARDIESRIDHHDLTTLLRRAAHAADTDAALESVLTYIADRPVKSWTDADADHFAQRAITIGVLFQEERLKLPSAYRLSPAERTRSNQLAERLRKVVGNEEDMQIVRAALLDLLQETETEND